MATSPIAVVNPTTPRLAVGAAGRRGGGAAGHSDHDVTEAGARDCRGRDPGGGDREFVSAGGASRDEVSDPGVDRAVAQQKLRRARSGGAAPDSPDLAGA